MQENDALMKTKITGETHFGELVQQNEDCIENVVFAKSVHSSTDNIDRI